MFRSRQFTTVVELEKQSMTFYPWNPKWKEVCVNKCQFNLRRCVNKALIAFGLRPVFWNSTCRFVLTACLWMSIGSWIAHHWCLLSGCFFLLETLLVILTTCVLQLIWPDKPRIIWCYKINMPLFICVWSRHMKPYLRKCSLIQMSIKKQ